MAMNSTESEIREHSERELTTRDIDEVAMLWSAIVAAAGAFASAGSIYFAFL
jgi:hypothetical protein